MDTYIPLKDRVKSQVDLETKQLTNLHEKIAERSEEWTKLNDWFMKTDPEAKKVKAVEADADALAVAAAATDAEAKVAAGQAARGD